MKSINRELKVLNNIAITLKASEDNENAVEGDDSNMEDEDNYMGSNQYDEYEMAGQPQDAEMIEAMRLERIIANDRWQSCLIRDKQGGEWTGSLSSWTTITLLYSKLITLADDVREIVSVHFCRFL